MEIFALAQEAGQRHADALLAQFFAPPVQAQRGREANWIALVDYLKALSQGLAAAAHGPLGPARRGAGAERDPHAGQGAPAALPRGPGRRVAARVHGPRAGRAGRLRRHAGAHARRPAPGEQRDAGAAAAADAAGGRAGDAGAGGDRGRRPGGRAGRRGIHAAPAARAGQRVLLRSRGRARAHPDRDPAAGPGLGRALLRRRRRPGCAAPAVQAARAGARGKAVRQGHRALRADLGASAPARVLEPEASLQGARARAGRRRAAASCTATRRSGAALARGRRRVRALAGRGRRRRRAAAAGDLAPAQLGRQRAGRRRAQGRARMGALRRGGRRPRAGRAGLVAGHRPLGALPTRTTRCTPRSTC